MKSQKESSKQTAFKIGITVKDLFQHITLGQHDDLAARLFAVGDALEKGDSEAIKKIARESKAKSFRALTTAAVAAATNEEARTAALNFVREALDEVFRWSRYRALAMETWEHHVRGIRSKGEQSACR